MLHYIVIIVVLINLSSSASFFPGTCPTVPVALNFDITKFAKGVWYLIYKDNYSVDLESINRLKCVEKHITYYPETDVINFHTYFLNDFTSFPKWHNSYGKPTDIPGIIAFLPLNGTDSALTFKTTELRIVDIDYNHYAVGYYCAHDTSKEHYLGVYIASRDPLRKLPDGKIREILKLFEHYDVNVTFVPIDWSDCRAHCPEW